MKRFKLFAMLMTISALSLTACGKDNGGASDDEPVNPGPGPVAAKCNNGVLEEGEVCDGTLLNNHSCADKGFTGTVSCAADCKSIDYSQCNGTLSLAKAYEADISYDLSGLLPDAYDDIAGFLNDPAETLINWGISALLEKMNVDPDNILAKVGVELVKGYVETAVNNYLADTDVKAVLDTAKDAVNAVTAMVSNFDVKSEMSVNNGQVSEEWKSLTFAWNFGCDGGDGCKKVLDFSTMGLTKELKANYTMNFDAETLTANFGNREFSLEYGVVIEYVYKNVLIPAVTGNDNAHSSADLLKKLIDTDKLAAKICESDKDQNAETFTVNIIRDITLTKDQLKTALEVLYTVGGSTLDEKINSVVQMGAAKLNTSGTFAAVDSDKDWDVDQLNAPANQEKNIRGTITLDDPTKADASMTTGNFESHGTAVEKI